MTFILYYSMLTLKIILLNSRIMTLHADAGYAHGPTYTGMYLPYRISCGEFCGEMYTGTGERDC